MRCILQLVWLKETFLSWFQAKYEFSLQADAFVGLLSEILINGAKSRNIQEKKSNKEEGKESV